MMNYLKNLIWKLWMVGGSFYAACKLFPTALSSRSISVPTGVNCFLHDVGRALRSKDSSIDIFTKSVLHPEDMSRDPITNCGSAVWVQRHKKDLMFRCAQMFYTEMLALGAITETPLTANTGPNRNAHTTIYHNFEVGASLGDMQVLWQLYHRSKLHGFFSTTWNFPQQVIYATFRELGALDNPNSKDWINDQVKVVQVSFAVFDTASKKRYYSNKALTFSVYRTRQSQIEMSFVKDCGDRYENAWYERDGMREVLADLQEQARLLYTA